MTELNHIRPCGRRGGCYPVIYLNYGLFVQPIILIIFQNLAFSITSGTSILVVFAIVIASLYCFVFVIGITEVSWPVNRYYDARLEVDNFIYPPRAVTFVASGRVGSFTTAGTAVIAVPCTYRTTHVFFYYRLHQHAHAQKLAPAVPNSPNTNESVNIEIKATTAISANIAANDTNSTELAKSMVLRKTLNAFVFMF